MTEPRESAMTRRKEVLFAILTIVISLVGVSAIAEILLRFLPVANHPLVVPVTAADPVFHYTPNRPFLFSRDWDLHLVNHGRVNNAGMVNDQDYRKEDTTPLVAVVGDSYIEAMPVPYAETVQGHLAKALDGRLRVYSYAASGAPLSQYIIWARYAVREYGAKALIINVVGNDFDESHEVYKIDAPGFWIYVRDPDGQLRLRLFEFHVGRIRSLVKHSALARYLFINLHVKSLFIRSRTGDGGGQFPGDIGGRQYAGNTAVEADTGRINASVAVMDAFFRDLSDMVGLPPTRVLFVMDGFRYPDQAQRGAGTYFDRMRRAFRERAEARGYEVIDVDPLFFSDFSKHGRSFEDSRDNHWNATAHGVVANAVMRSKTLTRFPF